MDDYSKTSCLYVLWQWQFDCYIENQPSSIYGAEMPAHLYLFFIHIFFQLSFDLIRCLQNNKYKTQIRDFEGKRMHMRNARQQQP